MIHTVKGLGIVNKPEVDVLLEFSCFFYDLTDVGNYTIYLFFISQCKGVTIEFLLHIVLQTLRDIRCGDSPVTAQEPWNLSVDSLHPTR